MLDILFDPYNLPFWILIIGIIGSVIAIIARPFSTYVKFVYPNAKFEAMGNPFIGEKELNSIVESKSVLSFKETINTLKDYNISGDDPYAIQKSLDDTFLQTVMMMKKDSAKQLQTFYDAYLERLDSSYIKNELKKILLGKQTTIDSSQVILPKSKTLLQQLSTAQKEELPPILKDYGFSSQLIEMMMADDTDLLAIDVAIDKHMINQFMSVRVPYKCDRAKHTFIKITLDMSNIKTLLRLKQLGYEPERCKQLFLGEGMEIAKWKYNELAELDQVPQVIAALEGTSYYSGLKNAIEHYNKDQSVQVFENVLDRLYLHHIKDLSLQYYLNLGPTLRFLLSKEFEIKNLKIIVKGISERLKPETIKRLLIVEEGA